MLNKRNVEHRINSKYQKTQEMLDKKMREREREKGKGRRERKRMKE